MIYKEELIMNGICVGFYINDESVCAYTNTPDKNYFLCSSRNNISKEIVTLDILDNQINLSLQRIFFSVSVNSV